MATTNKMNLNLINLDCTQWNKADWNDAYNQYCAHNQFGVMTKREYYDFVHRNHNRIKTVAQPLSDELRNKWLAGRRNARLWAKKRGCGMDGRLLVAGIVEQRDADALNIAERAEDIAVDTMQRLDYLIEKVRSK